MFYDVFVGEVKGSVSNSTTLTTYNSVIGFDITSGLGSPNANNLCNKKIWNNCHLQRGLD